MSANAEFVCGVGPFQSNDILIYQDSVTTFSIVTVAGKLYFRGTDGGSTTDLLATIKSLVALNKTYQWPELIFQITGAFASVGTEVRIYGLGGSTDASAGTWRVFVVCTTDTSHYKIRLKDVAGATIGTSSTEYAVGASDRVLRGQLDGANWKLWVDGTLEIDVAETDKIDTARLRMRDDSPLTSGQFLYWRSLTLWQSNSESDRPGTALTGEGRNPNGDKISQYSDEACANDNVGTYTKWDDLVAGAISDADFNCGFSTNDEKEISEFENTTLAALSGVHVWSRSSTNAADKATVVDIEENDGTNSQGVQQVQLTDTTWRRRDAGFASAPDAAAWTPTNFNSAGFGLRSYNTNDGHDRHSCIYVELFDIDNDPPPATTARSYGYVIG